MASPLARHNYHQESEAAVNKQINLEMHASYVYLSMGFYFDRDDLALPGVHTFFKKMSCEKRQDAEKLLKFQNKRGGRVVLQDVQKPSKDEWGTPLEATLTALELEKSLNQSLLDLHAISSKHKDEQMGDFLEGEFLQEQVKSIKEISDLITQLKRVGTGLGVFFIDKELQ